MTILTLLWRFTIGGAWKYLAAGAGVLALYLKGRSDAKAKADLRDLKANSKTIEEVLRETPSDDPADDIRRRMRERSK
jgi:hypothetical protein